MNLTAVLSLIGATLCWGTVPPMLKYLARPEFVPDGFTANFVRYPIAALFWLPWLVIGLRNDQVRRLWKVALIPAACNIVGQTFWSISPYHLDAAMAAFLFQLCSVVSILVAFVVFPDERRLARKPQFWAGTVLAVVGFIVLSIPSLLTGKGGTPLGVLFITLCALSMAFYGVSVRYVLRDGHPLILFGLVAWYTSFALVAMAPAGDPGSVLRLAPGPAILLIVSALVGIAFAHALFYIAVQRIGVAVSYLVLMTTPLISLAVSSVTLGEHFTPLQWTGGLLLLAGSAIAIRVHIRLREPAIPPPPSQGGIDMPEPG